MAKKSAGILLYRMMNEGLEIFLVHPGGPFWKNKDLEAWSIPKGEFGDEENALDAARREFEEETGHPVTGNFTELTPVKLKSGKMVYAWAVEGDIDAKAIRCQTFVDVEWPPHSGKFQSIPEVDKGEWLSWDKAKKKVNPSQVPLIDELTQKISYGV